MRIGVVAPPWLPIPPSGYGGVERAVHWLTEGLRSLGHEVVLKGADGDPCALWLRRGPSQTGNTGVELAHVTAAYEDLRDCDVISDHTIVGPQRRRPGGGGPPVIATMHGPLRAPFLIEYQQMASAGTSLVGVSKSQVAGPVPLPIVATIPHGLVLSDHPLGSGDDGYCLFLGRIHPNKAPHVAIDACRRAKRKLLLAGPIEGPIESTYYEQLIRPNLDADVRYVGALQDPERLEILGGAEALIAPNWEHEPFGLMVIEALACGTPVVAYRFGVTPQAIVNGHNGFLADDVAGLIKGLRAVDAVDRMACRLSVTGRFDSRSVARSYTSVIRNVVQQSQDAST